MKREGEGRKANGRKKRIEEKIKEMENRLEKRKEERTKCMVIKKIIVIERNGNRKKKTKGKQ